MNDKKTTVTEAYDLMLNDILSFESEIIPIDESLNRVLSKKVYYKIDEPIFDKAAMDGYAYYKENEDINKLTVISETIFAGDDKDIDIPKYGCVRIMTGAMVPQKANSIIRLEYTENFLEDSKRYMKIVRKESSTNIIKKGENAKTNDLMLDIKPLKAEDIAMLSSNGYSEIEVRRSPIVGIITTGNELINVHENLEKGKIYDSNSHLLINKLKNININSVFYGIYKDDYNSLYKVIEKAIKECDIIIVTGGISFGDMDLSKKVFDSLGIKTIFHKVMMKPGKPLYFGLKKSSISEKKAIFGIPGNPFAVFTCFENFIKPYIYNSLGYKYDNIFFKMPIARDYIRKKIDCVEYIPAKIIQKETEVCAEPLKYGGSSVLISGIEAIIKIDIGVKEIKAGDLIETRFL